MRGVIVRDKWLKTLFNLDFPYGPSPLEVVQNKATNFTSMAIFIYAYFRKVT